MERNKEQMIPIGVRFEGLNGVTDLNLLLKLLIVW